MEITDSIAVVTGANRGLGRRFAEQLLERGAAKVYAAARDPQRIDLPGVVPLQLDITDPASVARPRAATWAQTNVVRQELAPHGIEVTALHVGWRDTDMADYVDPGQKSDPAVVAAAALDGLTAGATERPLQEGKDERHSGGQ
jgi:NAD(P)-dependent dehydrogenase (short-subunit alcohol dehydrogenase family)